jgi:hypothetical protein
MRHTRYGYWLEEAGPVEPTRPLEGDTTADVVIVGAGYLGLWTAWQLKALDPGLDVVVLEAGLAGHGPSGRNGGFVSTLWDDLPILRDSVGDTRAVEVCRASERAVRGIGAFCAEQGVDARYRAAGTLQIATSTAQVGDWDELVVACAAVGAPDEAQPLTPARCHLKGGGGQPSERNPADTPLSFASVRIDFPCNWRILTRSSRMNGTHRRPITHEEAHPGIGHRSAGALRGARRDS